MPAINSRSLMDRHRTSNARYAGSSPVGSVKFLIRKGEYDNE